MIFSESAGFTPCLAFLRATALIPASIIRFLRSFDSAQGDSAQVGSLPERVRPVAQAPHPIPYIPASIF
jgi:hypothetical protein